MIVSQQIFRKIQVTESYSGTLPKPEILEKYDKILHGTAERILKMAENQASHRQKLEEKVVNTDSDNSKLGVWFAFVLAMSTIIGGGFLIYCNKNIEGLVAIVTAIVGLVSVFIYGKYQNKKELEKKEKQIDKIK